MRADASVQRQTRVRLGCEISERQATPGLVEQRATAPRRHLFKSDTAYMFHARPHTAFAMSHAKRRVEAEGVRAHNQAFEVQDVHEHGPQRLPHGQTVDLHHIELPRRYLLATQDTVRSWFRPQLGYNGCCCLLISATLGQVVGPKSDHCRLEEPDTNKTRAGQLFYELLCNEAAPLTELEDSDEGHKCAEVNAAISKPLCHVRVSRQGREGRGVSHPR